MNEAREAAWQAWVGPQHVDVRFASEWEDAFDAGYDSGRRDAEERYAALVEAWRAYRPLAWRNSKAAREARLHFFACMDRIATLESLGAPQ
jgi:hypothetical protein